MKNVYFLHSTAQKHKQAQVNVSTGKTFRCCGKYRILMVTEERMIAVNTFHGLQLNRKFSRELKVDMFHKQNRLKIIAKLGSWTIRLPFKTNTSKAYSQVFKYSFYRT